MRTAGWTDSVSVLDRVSAILDAFDGVDDGLGVSDLARRANLPKSTVSRIATELVCHRVLDREGDRLYLGLHLFELGLSVAQPRRLRQVALPIMSELRDATARSVELVLRDGADAVTLATARGGRVWPGEVGDRRWVFASALGRALMAYESSEVVSSALASAPPAGPHPDGQEVRRSLARIRATALAHGGHEDGMGPPMIATPILARGSVPVAALGIFGTADSDVSRVAPLLRAATMRVEKALRGL